MIIHDNPRCIKGSTSLELIILNLAQFLATLALSNESWLNRNDLAN